MASSKTREIEQYLADLAESVGAQINVVHGGRHPKVYFVFREKSRFIVIGNTPSDHRAERIVMALAKRTLRELGAAI